MTYRGPFESRALGQLDLNLLYTFHEVARLGGVTAAARVLGRTQPAISGRLKHLEQQLGVTLFVRTGHVMKLSPVGAVVLEEVGRVIATLGVVLDRTRGLDGEPAGTVRIGALPTLCAYLLSPLVVGLARAHHRVRIELSPGMVAPQIELLKSGDLDVLVSVGDVRSRGIEVRRLGDVAACAVLRSADRPPRGVMSARALRERDFVGYGRIGDPFFDAVWSFLERAHIAEGVRITVPNIQAMKQLVLEGGGVTILPRYTVVEKTLATRAVRGLDVRMPLFLATRPRADEVPVIREVVRRLAQRAAARSPA
jgi:DNA-binding transcriptional LysR family regulator